MKKRFTKRIGIITLLLLGMINNPNLMGIIYSCVSSELSFVKAAEEKNSGTGADA